MLWVVMRRGKGGDVVMGMGGWVASAWCIAGVDLRERLEVPAKRARVAQCVTDMRDCLWTHGRATRGCMYGGERRRLSGSEI